ncbi:MAG TPA: isochorismate synthase [Candidatus Eisenbacteria bacterium]|nr:isochorismate synthase [Candidatus Eisenbacteria bacterium]
MTPTSSSPAVATLFGRVHATDSSGAREPVPSTASGIHPRFTLETPDGERIVATGSVARFERAGGDPFGEVRTWLDALATSARLDGASMDGRSVAERLTAMMVFPFDTRSGAEVASSLYRAWIPRRVERRDASGAVQVVEWRSKEQEPAERRAPERPAWTEDAWSRDGWTRGVETSLERIRSGSLIKVVLSRCRIVRGSDSYDTEAIFRALNETYPGCYRFRYEGGDGSAFLGASPERLVAHRQGRIEADAVAGTGANGGGSLLEDPKETLEHEIVVKEILAALRPVADRVEADSVPSTHRLRNVTHLRTRVRAAARPGTHVLDLAARIHPSPAVAGSPRDAALELIRALEPASRGWYAGPIGWVSAGGEGELTLGLRAAMTRGREALLQAGAGIVLGSDPAREWEECEAKMLAMEEALRG